MEYVFESRSEATDGEWEKSNPIKPLEVFLMDLYTSFSNKKNVPEVRIGSVEWRVVEVLGPNEVIDEAVKILVDAGCSPGVISEVETLRLRV